MIYVIYHLYFLAMGGLFSYLLPSLVAVCSYMLYIIFCWFQISIYINHVPTDFNTGSYCPVCRTVTGMGLKHCQDCKKCVPNKWKHCEILEVCCDKGMRLRWMVLFKIAVTFYTTLNIICAMINIRILLLLPLHMYILKSTYRKSKRGINN